ncbi:Gfo/Idh/MocA family oxidoreductase [Kyrpidia sp.]|uniref:Gfo/Idh/MocA family protein n=1 Tax=Kyrpidia sp. TaxID=2073077 RepID=UPI00258FDAF6|nr:Gfo/Idh/MocA family oxidoreductase [Kyrpidia sp.]MCL6576115.1 Gfo/Idh/MocA family oxidoreductase [Kyrpidia sp.]
MTKVAVIGAGMWGRNLVQTFYALNALAAVVELNPQLRTEVKDKYPDVAVYEDYKQVLEDDIPAVVLATPAPTHADVVRDALLARKDVFVEKPMALSSAEAESMCLLAEAHDRILMVGHLLLYHPAIQWIKDFLNDGQLGRLQSIHQTRAKFGRVRSVENVLWSFGVHDIAVLLYLAGNIPNQISSWGQRILQSSIEDDVFLHMQFPDGVHAHLHTSWLWPEKERRLVLIGSSGMLVYEESKQQVVFHQKTVTKDLSAEDGGSSVLFSCDVQPLELECRHFLECIQKRREPVSNGRHGLEVIRVLEHASDILRKGIQR